MEGGVLRACSQRGSVGRQALLAHDVSDDCYSSLALIACRRSQQHIALLLNAPACQQTRVNFWVSGCHLLQRSQGDALQASSSNF